MPRDKSSNSKSSLRRSLRPRRSDKTSYQVGDVVEVSYKNGIELGTLICQVTSDRWIVKYKNNNMHEQQVSEKSFGQIIHKTDSQSDAKSYGESQHKDDVESSTTSSSSSKKAKKGQAKNKLLRVNNIRGSGSSSGTGNMSGDGGSNDGSRTRTPGSSRKGKKEPILSAREKRMRMRQEANDAGTGQSIGGRKMKKRRLKRDGASSTATREAFGKNKPKKEKEEVIKVKMNTGTLYLYRGMNPRAVFMRRY